VYVIPVRYITRCIFITTPFRLNRRSCLFSESGNASIPTFDLFSQQTASTSRTMNGYLKIIVSMLWKEAFCLVLHVTNIFCGLKIKIIITQWDHVGSYFDFFSDFWFIFTTDGEYVLSIYLLIAIFSDWKHRWRNTIYIQEIEIRSYVISLGDDDFYFQPTKNICYM
jgi:hypothetical protein